MKADALELEKGVRQLDTLKGLMCCCIIEMKQRLNHTSTTASGIVVNMLRTDWHVEERSLN